jgi:glycosyltransferase involved in cell wall biosynthesis
MKIALLTNCVPFVRGGAEHLVESLRDKLNEYGHEAMIIRIPLAWHPPERIVEHILAARLLRLYNVDRMIGFKFPAFYVRHDNKIHWLLHQFRQVYDLWGTKYQDIPDTPEGRRIREVVVNADNRYLREARGLYTNAPKTAQRLKKFNNLDAEVLYPPLGRSDHFRCDSYGDYLFCPSRITDGKRQALLTESMKYVRSGVRLVLAGQPETPADRERVEAIIRENCLEKRVQWIPRFISEDEKARLFAGALGCAYIPYDEDSYGYVTLESYHSRKPVITCRDSGDITVLVRDGQTGLVAEPTPAAIAGAMDNLYECRGEAERMGRAGYDLMMTLGINWETVVKRLTA